MVFEAFHQVSESVPLIGVVENLRSYCQACPSFQSSPGAVHRSVAVVASTEK
jgi:hypothetical protein